MPLLHRPHNEFTAKRGFTLVEIALVLSIIGLLIGAVVGGAAMLRQSELQTVMTDYGKYTAAVSNFRLQYGGLPGDMIDATSFWNSGGAGGLATEAGCQSGITANATCNGDGDGDMSDSIEPYLAWQQLTLARYVDGTFSGVASGGGAVPGINVPKSRVQGAGWSFGFKNGVGTANEYTQDLSNYMAFGTAIAGGLTRGAALIPNDAWQVDVKSDNGLPGTGRIVAMKPAFLANCASNTPNDALDATDVYNLTYATAACGLNMSLTLK